MPGDDLDVNEVVDVTLVECCRVNEGPDATTTAAVSSIMFEKGGSCPSKLECTAALASTRTYR